METADFRGVAWEGIAALVVALSRPSAEEARVMAAAQAARKPILGDFELFARALATRPRGERGRIVAVMGARGKSSVAALIGHVLKASGRDPQVGGEAGQAPLALAPPHPGAIYVLELRARDVALAPSLEADVAVFLNADTKEAVTAGPARRLDPRATDIHVLVGVDDSFGRGLATEMLSWEGGPTITPVSGARVLGRGVHAVGGVLFDAVEGRAQEVVDLRPSRVMLGRPSWQNAAAAYAACRRLGLEPGVIARHLLTFPGLPHRLQLVVERGPVRFIDDSYARDPVSASYAVGAFENVFWIAGGRSRRQSFEAVATARRSITKAYLIGEAVETIAAELRSRAVIEICRDLATAVSRAAADAQRSTRPDPVVLLSPACSAVDQFADAAARGQAFAGLAEGLPPSSDEEKPAKRQAGTGIAGEAA
jgi:UDP-N-acetylmuramoylalanine--D-glutamate ligase